MKTPDCGRGAIYLNVTQEAIDEAVMLPISSRICTDRCVFACAMKKQFPNAYVKCGHKFMTLGIGGPQHQKTYINSKHGQDLIYNYLKGCDFKLQPAKIRLMPY